MYNENDTAVAMHMIIKSRPPRP